MSKKNHEVLNAPHKDKDVVCVIKIGGSISTNKDGYYELDYVHLNIIGETLSRLKACLNSKIILVFGGGSFGNKAPVQYDLLERTDGFPNENVSKMTTIMFSMLSDITSILISHGVPAYPFQCSALVHQKNDGQWDIHTSVITEAIRQNCIPVITGDLVFKKDGNFMIFSSDNVPELLAKKLRVQHVIYYCDVDGFYNDISKRKVISRITPDEIEGYKLVAGPSSRQDVTGGMLNKLNQIQGLVNKGITVELLSFKHFSYLNRTLNKDIHFGTFFESRREEC